METNFGTDGRLEIAQTKKNKNKNKNKNKGTIECAEKVAAFHGLLTAYRVPSAFILNE